jgi:hypothetical protein
LDGGGLDGFQGCQAEGSLYWVGVKVISQPVISKRFQEKNLPALKKMRLLKVNG